MGAEKMIDGQKHPYVVYRFAVTDGLEAASKRTWRIARRFAAFLELRQALQSPDVLRDETARNTIDQLSFPSKTNAFGTKLAPELMQQRARELQKWLRGVLRWATRGAVLSFLHDDGSDNAVLDLAASQLFMAGSESAGMRWSRPLAMGNRSSAEKNSYLVRGVGDAQDLVLTVVTPPLHPTSATGGQVVNILSKSARGHFRSCLTEMDHRYVMPPSELAYIRRSADVRPARRKRSKDEPEQGYKLLIFREVYPLGSLRDMIFRTQHPLEPFAEKYMGSSGK